MVNGEVGEVLIKNFYSHPYVIEHLICYFVGDYLNVLTYGVSVGY